MGPSSESAIFCSESAISFESAIFCYKSANDLFWLAWAALLPYVFKDNL